MTPRRTLAALALVLAAWTALTTPVGAVARGCQKPVDDLRHALQSLATPSKSSSNDDKERIRRQGVSLFNAAKRAHPECADDFVTLGAQLQAEARSKTLVKGTPFLGPIGWLWNNVYYRVFSGNDVMMALFGWALLVSPVILVVAIRWVMRGARAGLHKPVVPEHLRVD
jgi:hypothetical protein